MTATFALPIVESVLPYKKDIPVVIEISNADYVVPQLLLNFGCCCCCCCCCDVLGNVLAAYYNVVLLTLRLVMDR